MKKKTKITIVICYQCDGAGEIDVGHKEFEYIVCPECNGLGRLKEIETKEYEKLDLKKTVSFDL